MTMRHEAGWEIRCHDRTVALLDYLGVDGFVIVFHISPIDPATGRDEYLTYEKMVGNGVYLVNRTDEASILKDSFTLNPYDTLDPKTCTQVALRVFSSDHSGSEGNPIHKHTKWILCGATAGAIAGAMFDWVIEYVFSPRPHFSFPSLAHMFFGALLGVIVTLAVLAIVDFRNLK
jgi:hypothetical protein